MRTVPGVLVASTSESFGMSECVSSDSSVPTTASVGEVAHATCTGLICAICSPAASSARSSS